MAQTNEQKGLDALISPQPITIGKLARLERINSPLMRGDFDKATFLECVSALYVLSLPAAEVVKHLGTLEADALEYADTLTHEQYRKDLTELMDGLFAWWAMLPRPDEEAKKNATATGGSSSSSNGAAAPTATA